MVHRKIPGLYSFVKLLCRTLFHIFFRDYDAFHSNLVPLDEPILVISNHGNYLLDGLALLATYPGQISFLMAQPNFKTAIGGIARKIGAIPVLRFVFLDFFFFLFFFSFFFLVLFCF
jgi:1-acyl-sn-glycerol-3-phosphate acyltransferase